MLRKADFVKRIGALLCIVMANAVLWGNSALAFGPTGTRLSASSGNADKSSETVLVGGGYAVSGQSGSIGYTAEVYDETNGLITTDANYILGSSDGFIWIGSYSGIFRYDGTVFEKIEYSEGLTSGRGLFEDSKGRIWVGTNDNGVVVIDGTEATWITYKDGLPSSSIRVFTEDRYGNVYIGTTAGVCYADTDLRIHTIDHALINEDRVLQLQTWSDGTVFGMTKSGYMFSIKNKEIDQVYDGKELGTGKITSILADPEKEGVIYLATDENRIYYGEFGSNVSDMYSISVFPLNGIHWLSYDCDRVWVSSTTQVGYIDERSRFQLVEDLPVYSGIEMTASDYQGNLWIASSTQGVTKLVSCNFTDLTKEYELTNEAVNSTCIVNKLLYIGTDTGLRILDSTRSVENRLTRTLSNVRIRCLMKDSNDNLWISTFSSGFGLVCYTTHGEIKKFTVNEGMPSNEIRCTKETADGAILVGTNGGLAVIRQGNIERIVHSNSQIKNTVFLTVEEGDNGQILVGTDGDGIYVIDGDNVKRLGREAGLTSDVIMRIKKDDTEDLYWIIASNAISYIKDGTIHNVTSFPVNNNYDMFFDSHDNMWVLSSYGILMVSKKQMLNDKVSDYRLFTIASGLPSTPTSNSYSEMDEEGTLYIAGRQGVSMVNVNNFFDEKMDVKACLKSVYVGDELITPDSLGRYNLPATDTRIKINAAVLDYTLVDPQVHIFMEGNEDDAIWVNKSRISTLEYTGMNPGNYTLHIQVLSGNNTEAMLDQTYQIIKQPRLWQLTIVRVFAIVLTVALTGFFVWRLMVGTVIKRQIDEIRQARDDAQRANTAKTRFLANISHEIRTPINTILGMDEMIMREDATGVPKGYFMSMMNYAFDIKNATDSLLGLINDLLDISKIESGKMHLVEQEYDIRDLLRSIISMIRVKSTEKELTFDVVVDEIIPIRLYGDDGKIKQIVLNLLTNAVKYTEKGGFILSVALTERENETAGIAFSVKDTGIGVKAEDMDKLFTAYERLDEQKNSGIQGTGLGLDISRRFAEMMGGSLTCTSVYGQGSDFVLAVKQKIIDETPVGLFVEHDDSTAKGPYVPKFIAPDADVLVVDDNPMNLAVIKGLLKATKIFVTTANSGEDCLEKMKTTKFNVVLLDHMMPGMDGVETVGKIRETDKDIPVYALTANSSVGEEFYKSKGFTGYLAKPIETEQLEKTIMKHLPEEIMFKPEPLEAMPELETMPEELGWIYETEGITVEEGIKNSGGISSYIFSLKLFLETIDGNANVIRDAYEAGDIRLYTIKVHALKSSARIIGALGFSELCAKLEDAGNRQDKDFITAYNDELLKEYYEYKEKLQRLDENSSDVSAEDKKEISEDELKDAYGALGDMIPQMDYDAVEYILNDLKAYALPKKDAEIIAELGKKLKVFDWDGMEGLLKEKK